MKRPFYKEPSEPLDLKSGWQDTVRTFSGRHPELGSGLAAAAAAAEHFVISVIEVSCNTILKIACPILDSRPA